MGILRYPLISRLAGAAILCFAVAIPAIGLTPGAALAIGISPRAALAYSPSGATASGKTAAQVAQDCNSPESFPIAYPGTTVYYTFPLCTETSVVPGTAITLSENQPEDPSLQPPIYGCDVGGTASSGYSHAVTTGSSWSVGGTLKGEAASILFGLVKASLSAAFSWSETYSTTDTTSETVTVPYGSLGWLDATKEVGVAEFNMTATYQDGSVGHFLEYAEQPNPTSGATWNALSRVISDDEYNLHCLKTPTDVSYLNPLSPTSAGWYPSDGRIVNSVLNDMCLDDTNWSTQPGTQLQVWQCASGQQANEQWAIQFVGSAGFVIKNVHSGLCLDALYSKTAPGTPVDEYTCNGTKAQDWYYDKYRGTVAPEPGNQAVYELVNANSGSCAVPSGTVNGALMVLGSCADQKGVGQSGFFAPTPGGSFGLPPSFYSVDKAISPSSTFSVSSAGSTSTGSLVNLGSGKCLDDTNWSTAAWTQMQIWDCGGGANEKWTRQSPGLLQNGYSGLCLNVYGNYSTAFTPAIQYGCNASDPAQVSSWKWTSFSGQPDGYEIVNDHGNCLDVNSGGTGNGTKVDWYPCNHTGAQAWYLG